MGLSSQGEFIVPRNAAQESRKQFKAVPKAASKKET
jgi:hypothetical protein